MNHSEPRLRETLTATSTISFGKKHRGKTVEQVLIEDPSYILWCIENTDHTFVPEVIARARDITLKDFSIVPTELEENTTDLKHLMTSLQPAKDAWEQSQIDTIQYFLKLSRYILGEMKNPKALFVKL